MSINGDLIKYH